MIQAGPSVSLQTRLVGAHHAALMEGVLVAPLDFRCTQVGFNLLSVQVCFGGSAAKFVQTSSSSDSLLFVGSLKIWGRDNKSIFRDKSTGTQEFSNF